VVEQQVRIGQAWRSAMLNRVSRQSPHYAASFPPTTRVFGSILSLTPIGTIPTGDVVDLRSVILSFYRESRESTPRC